MNYNGRKNRRDSGQFTTTPWQIYLLIGIIGFIVVSVAGYGFYKGIRMNRTYSPMIDAAMEIKLETCLAHLWFEEIISGDRHEDLKTVWKHIDKAGWYAKAMLEGARNSEGTFIPLNDAAMSQKIEDVQKKLVEFKVISKQRMAAKGNSGVGSPIDQTYDAFFNDLLDQADQVETRLQQVMAKDLSTFQHTQVALIAMCLLLFLSIGIVFWRFDRLRTRDFFTLHEANENLKSEAVERKRAEAELLKLKLGIERSGDAIFTTNTDGIITYVNKAFEDLYGYETKDVVDKVTPRILKSETPTPEFYEQFWKSLLEKQVVSGEMINKTKNGDLLSVEVSANPIIDTDGAIIGYLAVQRDVTATKRAEDQLNSYRKELESTNEQLEEAVANANQLAVEAELANQAKSEFLANMSHEIRTPMNGVLGFADMLFDTNLAEDQRDYADAIKRSGESLLSLINDILDFSKIEAGQLDFEEVEFDPELLAYDVCDLIRPKIGFKPIEILCHIGDNIPFRVVGDPTRFRQVLTNLMGNAPKFTDAGEIELFLDVEEEKDGRVKLHAKIRDTGIGIPTDKLTTIFEPFQQADGSTTRMYGGTGLGLSICKKISELMGGNVWAESEENKGSIFHFTAWLGESENKDAKRIIPVSLSGKKALIIDDNQTNLKILTHHLESVGMGVVALTDGKDALSTLQKAQEDQKPFDLCIADIQMPDMRTYEVAKEIRNPKFQFQDLPLVALSSLMGWDAKKCEEAGFDGFLSKPVNRNKLYQMLERIFGEKKYEDEKDKTAEHKIRTQYSVREEIKHSVCILLAEDNPINQKLAKIVLTKAGYQVEVANNGKEAVEKYTTSPDDFDLILMDIQMPEMDGMEATQTIREKGFNSIPIVAMTANAMKGDREACLEAGMDDYITKPIKRELVFEILQKWIFNRSESRISADSKENLDTKESEF